MIDPRIVPERPELGPRPHLGYTASAVDRAADRRDDDAALAKFLQDDRSGGYVIGGELVVMKARGEVIDPLFSPAEAAALGSARDTIFLGLLGASAALRLRLRSGRDRAAQGAQRSENHRPAHHRGAGLGRRRASAAARRSQGADRLACAPPLLSQLRHADARGAGRLAARLPVMQGRAFPAHRSGRDHAGDLGRALRARPFAAICADHVVGARRLCRAGRDHRGSGAARSAGRSRHPLRQGHIRHVAAVAVPELVDDRLPRASAVGRQSSSTAARSKTRAGFRATNWR